MRKKYLSSVIEIVIVDLFHSDQKSTRKISFKRISSSNKLIVNDSR